MKAVHGAGAAAMHELLVVMQIEAIEVGALAALDLLDAQDLPLQQFDRLAGAGLDENSEMIWRAVIAPAPSAVGFMRGGIFMKRRPHQRHPVRRHALRDVRSSSSSCCWFTAI